LKFTRREKNFSRVSGNPMTTPETMTSARDNLMVTRHIKEISMIQNRPRVVLRRFWMLRESNMRLAALLLTGCGSLDFEKNNWRDSNGDIIWKTRSAGACFQKMGGTSERQKEAAAMPVQCSAATL